MNTTEEKNSAQPVRISQRNHSFFDALQSFVDTALANFSEENIPENTGWELERCRRILESRTRGIRKATWEQLYPALKPFLTGSGEPIMEPPTRIGAPYRRHADLVEMISEQKVLLDEFDLFGDRDRKQILTDFAAALGREVPPAEYGSLDAAENRLMGIFLAMTPEMRDEQLAKLTIKATAEARRRRSELF